MFLSHHAVLRFLKQLEVEFHFYCFDFLCLDILQYKTHKDKGVMMAARSLIALYRETHPELLHRRDRGKLISMKMQATGAGGSGSSSSESSESASAYFGAQKVLTDVPGAEFLAVCGI